MATAGNVVTSTHRRWPRLLRRAGAGEGSAWWQGIDEERMAQRLGWLSLGLGVAGIAGARSVVRLIGAPDDDDSRALVRAVGLREVASGYGILSRPEPVRWVWSRVGGDVMDLALLGAAFASRGARRGRLAAAAGAVAGVTALDALCGAQLGRRRAARPFAAHEAGTRTRKAITINRPPEEVYRFWRDVQNLPRFMKRLESVQVLDERRSRWRAKGPAGRVVEWEAEITGDEPNHTIAWRSTGRADVAHGGVVHFQPGPGGRGTEVRLELAYRPPGGALTATAARLLGQAPEQRIQDDLRALKQLLEAGEIATGEGPAARSGPSLFGR
jgi:uncharacterized membrane protein